MRWIRRCSRACPAGAARWTTCCAGIDAARDARASRRIKINCVVQRGVNEDQVLPLVERFRGSGHVLRFIEYMDVGTCNGWQRERVVPSSRTARPHRRALAAAAAGAATIAAKWPTRYAFDDGGGEVGFVSSVSAPFCGDCHRARVSADGTLYTCLFAGEGTDLRAGAGAGRSGAGRPRRRHCGRGARDRYSELRGSADGVAAGTSKCS